MPYPYTAIIKEKTRVITGIDADGKYCLDGNEKLEITVLEPETFRALTLREVAKLTFTGGRWLLDEKDITGRWLDSLENPGGLKDITSAAYTDMKTVHSLRQTLDGLPPEARTKIKGVAWFDEGFDRIEGETPERCKQLQDEANRHYGGGFEIHPRPPAKEFRPVLLADFHVSPQSTGDGPQVMSYEAVIEGRQCQVRFDTDKSILVDGSRYEFIPIKKPDFKFSTRTLVSVSRLRWDNAWLVDDEPLQDRISAEMQKTEAERNLKYTALDKFLNSEFPTNLFVGLSALLTEMAQTPKPMPASLADMQNRRENPWQPSVSASVSCKPMSKQPDREDVRAVAWFEGEVPVLLRRFECLPSNTNPERLVQELTKAIEANAEQKNKAALHKANELASLNLEEALSKWFQFDPPSMNANTKARIEKAVRMYLTDNQKRSLRKIAKEFEVAPKTVSTWFASFTKHTGFKVVRHRRHESVANHLKAESSRDSESFDDDENAN